VLVTVDPLHAHAKPAALDEELLRQGRELASTFGGQLHASHFYNVASPIPTGFMVEPMPLPVDLVSHQVRDVRKAFRSLVSRYRLGARGHLLPGSAALELPDFVASIDARIVVMGAVSRTGLRRLFIGSTAERVIDALNCDVFIVKPAGFKTPVPKKMAQRPVVLPPL
jgi:universal stress protein E